MWWIFNIYRKSDMAMVGDSLTMPVVSNDSELLTVSSFRLIPIKGCLDLGTIGLPSVALTREVIIILSSDADYDKSYDRIAITVGAAPALLRGRITASHRSNHNHHHHHQLPSRR